jgi:hypothetical protein
MPYGRFDILRQISYRFRLVSISCDPSFIFSIDGHQFYVIEVEGQNVQPLLIDSLQIFVGAQFQNHSFRYADQIPDRPTLLCCRKLIFFRHFSRGSLIRL